VAAVGNVAGDDFLNNVAATVDELLSLGTEYQVYVEDLSQPLSHAAHRADGSTQEIEESDEEARLRVRQSAQDLNPRSLVLKLQELKLHEIAAAVGDLWEVVSMVINTDIDVRDDTEMLAIDMYSKQKKAIDSLRGASAADPGDEAATQALQEAESTTASISSFGLEYQSFVAGNSTAYRSRSEALQRISAAFDAVNPLRTVRKSQILGFAEAAEALDVLRMNVFQVLSLEEVGWGTGPKEVLEVDVRGSQQKASNELQRARAGI
jgi:hypothetical protein